MSAEIRDFRKSLMDRYVYSNPELQSIMDDTCFAIHKQLEIITKKVKEI